MKTLILDYKRCCQKCPCQRLRIMQQFILEEHLDIIASESGDEIDEVMDLERDGFIGIMLRMHQANSSRKWRLMVKLRKWNNPTSLCQLLFNMWQILHFRSTLQEELIVCLIKKAKMFVTGLKPDLFREEIFSRSCETLQEAINESTAELSTYRDILENTDLVKG